MSSIRSRLTFSNVASALALFIALSTGGAYAANTIGSSDVIDESLLSQDIKNGEVKNSELAADGVTSSKLANGSVQNSDLGPDAVTTSKIKAGNVGATDVADDAILTGKILDGNVFTSDLADGAVTNAKLADGSVGTGKLQDDAVTGAKVADDKLDGNDISESALNLNGFFAAAGSSGTGCTADSGTLSLCASTSITLARPGKLLVNATGEWHTFTLDDTAGVGSGTDLADRVRGRCRLSVDGGQIGGSQSVGERQQSGVLHNHPEGAQMALTALSGVVTAGAHTVDLSCTEEDGDLDWSQINLTAALIDDAGAARPGRAPAPAGADDVADPGKKR